MFRYPCNGPADVSPELAAEPRQLCLRFNAIGTVKPYRKWGRQIGITSDSQRESRRDSDLTLTLSLRERGIRDGCTV